MTKLTTTSTTDEFRSWFVDQYGREPSALGVIAFRLEQKLWSDLYTARNRTARHATTARDKT